MNIDLTKLHNFLTDEVDLSNTYNIPKEYIYDDNVIEANNIIVNGRIILKDSKDYIECNIQGKITMEDSISLEPIYLEINIDYNDFLDDYYKKNENTLDIFQFLWENIVLEVPLQFTKVEDLSKFHGDGWKLISEEELKHSSNPFSELLKDFDNKE